MRTDPPEQQIQLTDGERQLLGRVLEDFIVRTMLRLVAQGINRKLVVREMTAVLQEMFPGTKVVDVGALLGRAAPEEDGS